MGAPPPSFYFEKLYPLQDEVLAVVSRLDTGLYLTGVTAASRAYLRHRFSDDLGRRLVCSRPTWRDSSWAPRAATGSSSAVSTRLTSIATSGICERSVGGSSSRLVEDWRRRRCRAGSCGLAPSRTQHRGSFDTLRPRPAYRPPFRAPRSTTTRPPTRRGRARARRTGARRPLRGRTGCRARARRTSWRR